LHPGEDPRDCANRELEEEIGYKAGTLEHVTSAYTTPGFTDEVIHIYKATQLQKGKQDLGHDEVLEIAELPLERTITMIREGVIKDAKTIVGLQSVYLQILGENIGEGA
ncbi:MAG: NUDIX hydrolase, partial [Nitrospirae bacterium]|nr:NUDIX hydrolase [Nitrospirota bacterium]